MTTKKEYNMEEHIYVMLLELIKLECSNFFRNPVDVVLAKCPDYYDVVKQPMDLNTIKVKLLNKLETI